MSNGFAKTREGVAFKNGKFCSFSSRRIIVIRAWPDPRAWFKSPKKGWRGTKKGFQCLIYLHRYTRDTLNLVLNRYVWEYQAKLRSRLEHLKGAQATAATAKAKTEARKEADKITKVLHEVEEWERQSLLPLAQARIELDLDDGVKVNYLKLAEVLAPIPGLAAKEDE